MDFLLLRPLFLVLFFGGGLHIGYDVCRNVSSDCGGIFDSILEPEQLDTVLGSAVSKAGGSWGLLQTYSSVGPELERK